MKKLIAVSLALAMYWSIGGSEVPKVSTKYYRAIASNPAIFGKTPKLLTMAVESSARKHAVPILLLVALIEVESGWNPRAVNKNRNGTKDLGIMQLNNKYLEYYTWKFWDGSKLDPFDYNTNIEVGTAVLRYLYNLTGSWEDAIVAYNCGYTTYKKGKIPSTTRKYKETILARIEELGGI